MLLFGDVKIGFVLYDYYPFGGLQDDCLATALATHKRGHEVTVITRTWKGSKNGVMSLCL